MKFYSAILCAWLLTGCQAYIQKAFLPTAGIRPATESVTVTRNVAFTTPDGVRLVADVFQPSSHAAAPTILVRIPFTDTFGNRLRSDAVAYFWAGRGYNVVIQGTRGRYKSSGDYYPLWHERDDGIATLRWLADQAWFDGRLGMWGGSTFGYTQWVLADQVAPGPQALMIQIASTDFYSMFYPGGAFSLENALFWAVRSRGAEDTDPSADDLERGFASFPVIEADDRAAGDTGFFNDWASHVGRDSYWQSIDGHDRARTLRAPVLLMGGWFDPFLPGQIRDFQRLRNAADPHVAAESRLIIGPWSHADAVTLPGTQTQIPYRQAALAPSIDWFDRHLLGQTNTTGAPVKIFVMGDNVWRDEQEWPLARAQSVVYYLDRPDDQSQTGRLGLASPAHDIEPYRYVYDPRDPTPTAGGAMLGPRAGIARQNAIEARDDVLLFFTEPLAQDTEITGEISLVLHAATDAPSTDFTAKLVDRYPDGTVYNVCDGILRHRFARAGHAEEIVIHLWPTSMVFKKGHRIGLEIASANYPRYDRNPNTGNVVALETRPVPAHQTVFVGTSHPSRLLLPMVPRP